MAFVAPKSGIVNDSLTALQACVNSNTYEVDETILISHHKLLCMRRSDRF